MSSKINLQTCEYACKSSIFQDNQLIYNKSKKYGRIDIENNNMAENLSYFDNIETVELSSAIESVLSEEEKIYIYLKYVYGYKSAEIAEIYNVTDISVRKKLERAKAKLKKYFEEETND